MTMQRGNQNQGTPNTPADPQEQWKHYVAEKARKAVSMIVSGEKGKQAFGRIVVALSAAAAATPDIMRCSDESVARAVAWCALTGIMPSPGGNTQVYLLPKKIKGVWQLQCWPNHRAYKAFAHRAGWAVSCTPVHLEDEFSIEDDTIHHKPNPDRNCDRDTLRGIIVRAWPHAHPESKVARWVNKDTIEKRRRASDANTDGEFSPWVRWYMEQAEKTAIKYCAQRGEFPLDDSVDYLDEETMSARLGQQQAQALPSPAQAPSAFADLGRALGQPAPQPQTMQAEVAEAEAMERGD